MKNIIASLLLIILQMNFAFAQDVEMGDVMRSEGKIYVVVAVAFTSLAILSFYMIRIDKKVNRLEKDLKK